MEYEIALAGLIVGTLIGLTGIGGGSLLTPTLIVFFKVNPLTAVGSDLVFNAFTKLFGSAQHGRQGTINYRLALLLASGSIPAALAGIGLISLLEHVYEVDADKAVTRILASTLVLAGAVMILRPMIQKFSQQGQVQGVAEFEVRKSVTIALGAGTGFLVGMTSIGSGALIVPVLTLLYPLSMRSIVGTDIFHALLLAGVASMAHWGVGNVDWGLSGNLLIGSIPGVLFGARLAVVAPEQILRTALGVLVILSGIRLM